MSGCHCRSDYRWDQPLWRFRNRHRNLFGALIIGVLRNGLDLMGVTDHIKLIAIGSMIIFAVLLDYYRRRLTQSES